MVDFRRRAHCGAADGASDKSADDMYVSRFPRKVSVLMQSKSSHAILSNSSSGQSAGYYGGTTSSHHQYHHHYFHLHPLHRSEQCLACCTSRSWHNISSRGDLLMQHQDNS